MLELRVGMGRSSLILICCLHLLLLEPARSYTPSKNIVVYGLEQGSRFKAPKHSNSSYLLQLGSFANLKNALHYKVKLESQFHGHVTLIPSKGNSRRYQLVIGPFAKPSSLVAISRKILAQQNHKNSAKKFSRKFTKKNTKRIVKNFKKKIAKKQPKKISIVQIKTSILPEITNKLSLVQKLSQQKITQEGQTLNAQKPSKPSFSYLPHLNYGARVVKDLKNISADALVNNEGAATFSADKQRTEVSTLKASYLPSFATNRVARQYPYQNRKDENEQNQNPALAENEPRRKAWASIKGKSPDITRPLSLDKSDQHLISVVDIKTQQPQSYIAPLLANQAPRPQQQDEDNWVKNLFLAIQKQQTRRIAWAFIKGKFTDITNYISLVPTGHFQPKEQEHILGESYLLTFHFGSRETLLPEKNRHKDTQPHLFLILKENKPRRKTWAYIKGKFTDVSHSTTLCINADSIDKEFKQTATITDDRLLTAPFIAPVQKDGSYLPPLPNRQNNDDEREKNLFLSHKAYNPRRKGWALIKGRFTDITNPTSFDLTRHDSDLEPSYLPPFYIGARLSQVIDESDIIDHWYKALNLERNEARQKQKAYQLFQGKSPTMTSLLPFDTKRRIEVKEHTLPQNNASREKKNNFSQNSRTSYEPVMKLKPLGQLASASDMSVVINLSSAVDLQSMDEEISYMDQGKKITIDLKHYNPAIFTLAYDVFVMNANIRFAYRIANAAVNHDPGNIAWREKLAQSALWAGNAEVALDQWMYFIAHHYETKKYMSQALTLAKQVNNFDAQATIYQLLLKESPHDKALLLEYAQVMQKQGFPNRASKMLRAIPNSDVDPQFLEQLIAISKGTDHPKAELQYLQKLTAIDRHAVKPRLEEADILFSQGDLENAFKLYQDVSSQIKPDDTNFWRGYADLALLTANSQEAIIAFKTLMHQGTIDVGSALQLVELQQFNGQKEEALSDARQGFQRFPNDIRFPKQILSLGTDLNKWEEMKHFLDSLPAPMLTELKNTPNYAVLIAITNRHVGLVVEAFQAWKRILDRWPNLTTVQNNYLWYLIDYHELRQLEFLISRSRHVFGLKPELWEAFSNALTNIGDYQGALTIMKQHRELVNKHYDMLLNIVDLFEQNNRSYEAHYLKRRALYLLLNEVAPHPEKLTLKQTLAYAEFVRAFAPASMVYDVMVKLGEKLFVNPTIDEQIIAWALESENYDLARFMIRTHEVANIHTPPWMSLTLALEEGDRDLMEYLLFNSPKILPYRDRVTAAVETGNIRLAQEYAYIGLADHPFDHLMYDLFKETMLPWSNNFTAEIADETWGNVSGPLAKASARLFVTPSLSITPYVRTWSPRTNDKFIIAWTPSIDETAGIIARKYLQNGWIELNVAERRSLAQVYPIVAKWHRDNTFIPRLNSELTLSYHVRADETTALILGGMKNEINLSLDYAYKSRDSYDAEIGAMRFYGQDGFYLGSGTALRAHWQHKFFISYPDWNINFYYDWLDYHTRDGVVPVLLQKIIPLSFEDPVASFYMPLSDLDGALTFGFGQQYKKQYTQTLKPFAEVGMLYSRLFKWGKIIEGGIATSLFGRDHLVLFGEYTTNQQQVNPLQANAHQGSQVYYIIGMKYDYYF